MSKKKPVDISKIYELYEKNQQEIYELENDLVEPEKTGRQKVANQRIRENIYNIKQQQGYIGKIIAEDQFKIILSDPSAMQETKTKPQKVLTQSSHQRSNLGRK